MMSEVAYDSGPSPKAATNRGAKPRSTGSGILHHLKNLDIYTKLDEDYKVQTSQGATLSIIGWIIIAILVMGEVNNFLTPKMKEHMTVDTTLGQRLRINVNISFHALTCAEVHLDAMDVAGDNQLNIEHDMLKQRLSPLGVPLGPPSTEIIGKVSYPHLPVFRLNCAIFAIAYVCHFLLLFSICNRRKSIDKK
jgi:hypothetical protein